MKQTLSLPVRVSVSLGPLETKGITYVSEYYKDLS